MVREALHPEQLALPLPEACLAPAVPEASGQGSMYLPDTTGMSPRQIRDVVNGFRKD